MTRKSLQVLAAIVVGLVLLMFALQTDDSGSSAGAGEPLLPGFRAAANSVSELRITPPADAATITLRLDGEQWRVADRNNYPADVGLLRQLVIALAEAKIVEEKTANPELYDRLGVDDPTTGGKGTLVAITAADSSVSLVLGDSAQGDYRYARVADQATSFLIDQDPDVPTDAGDWLVAGLVDIPAERIRRVTIAHADGEEIVIEKSDREQADFAVIDIPGGRELSYASVANGTGGVLGNLELEDVRPATDAAATTAVTFEAWDGLTVIIEAFVDADETSWFAFAASANQAEEAADVSAEGAAINARLAGWQFRLGGYKKNLLLRRWDDLLKAETAAE